MTEPTPYAIEVLRSEYYRLGSQIRAVPEELWAAGYSSRLPRENQRQVVDALDALGAMLTPDMESLRATLGG